MTRLKCGWQMQMPAHATTGYSTSKPKTATHTCIFEKRRKNFEGELGGWASSPRRVGILVESRLTGSPSSLGMASICQGHEWRREVDKPKKARSNVVTGAPRGPPNHQLRAHCTCMNEPHGTPPFGLSDWVDRGSGGAGLARRRADGRGNGPGRVVDTGRRQGRQLLTRTSDGGEDGMAAVSALVSSGAGTRSYFRSSYG